MQPIHTVNSRDHVLLEIVRDHYGNTELLNEIQRLHSELIDILSSKDIEYKSLRPALVPSNDKEEAMFIFDSSKIESGSYGREVLSQLLPLLDPRTTQSILHGDLTYDNPRLIHRVLNESLVKAGSPDFDEALLFGVYLNNLSNQRRGQINQGLIDSNNGYIGFLPTTFQSPAKMFASTTMSGLLVKKGKTFIMRHEEDRSNSENINITKYDLEQYGYKIKSLQDYYFSIFLVYKIERPAYIIDKTDIEIALNSISSDVQPIDRFNIVIDTAKHGYLLGNKLGLLKKAGLAEKDRGQLESLIKEKVHNSYIYNLVYDENHNVMKFNILLEFDRPNGYPARTTISFEYIPNDKSLRLITLC